MFRQKCSTISLLCKSNIVSSPLAFFLYSRTFTSLHIWILYNSRAYSKSSGNATTFSTWRNYFIECNVRVLRYCRVPQLLLYKWVIKTKYALNAENRISSLRSRLSNFEDLPFIIFSKRCQYEHFSSGWLGQNTSILQDPWRI